jgi:ketosteroid isomerase-like protein
MPSKNLITGGCLLVFSLPASAAAELADVHKLTMEVICAEAAFSDAAEARDLSRFLEFVDPDARFVSDSVARGKAAVAESWARMFEPDGPLMRWRPATTEVSADGTLALSRGPYRARGIGKDGTPRESWGHFSSTWRKDEDGRWMVLFDGGGDDGMTPSNEEIALLQSDPPCP